MNREIKFRGITNDGRNNPEKWVYGQLVQFKEGAYIFRDMDDYENVSEYMVDSKTVGQYTGLKDKNGKEIYEGDIFLCNEKTKMYVMYYPPSFVLTNNNDHIIPFALYKSIEVIGNIYDNPDLLNSKTS
jgi:uncharacterized phage protein (TIGR01671 family)